MKNLKVKIVDCTSYTAWYKNRVGEEFEVKTNPKYPLDYLVIKLPYFILKKDCIIVKEPAKHG